MSDEPEQPVGTRDPATVTDAARTRRPSSLRAAASSAAASSAAASSDSASSEAASSEAAPSEATSSQAAAQRPKLTPPPLPGKLTPPSFLRRDSKPEAQDAGPSPSQKLVTLVSERPEVGLGIAFAAGLVIATILKRLAR